MAKTNKNTLSFGNGSPDLLALVLSALEAKNRIPEYRPTLSLPSHFNRDTICEFYLERKPGGWVGNVAFKNVPAGTPDVIGTPEAFPFQTEADAFLAGASIICEIVTGSPELPFFLAGDKLICVA
jgi:hypothetical protein